MSQYRNYLLAKNKAQEKNLNSYRTQYETSTGKITPEEAQVQLELNDNTIDEEQIDEELRDLLRKYIPNTYYLDSVLNSSKLTDAMKYDLYLNFATAVEPKVNAIRNRKLSVEKFTAFLVQLAQSLAQAGLTANMNSNINNLTNAFRAQINQYQSNQAGLSHEDLAETLVEDNIEKLNAEGITKASIGGKNTNEIITFIKKLLAIDRLMINFEKSAGMKKSYGVNVISLNDINALKMPISNKTQLQNLYQNYFDNITDADEYKTIPFKLLQEAYQARQGLLNTAPAPAPTPAPVVNPTPLNPSSNTFTPVIVPSKNTTPITSKNNSPTVPAFIDPEQLLIDHKIGIT